MDNMSDYINDILQNSNAKVSNVSAEKIKHNIETFFDDSDEDDTSNIVFDIDKDNLNKKNSNTITSKTMVPKKKTNAVHSTSANSNSELECIVEPIFIPSETTRRLIKDVRDITKNPLNSHGIYYKHDENDILKGYAMIIGPKDTPYAYGYYLYEFYFPTNYPHSPPKVVFKTGDGIIRFHPNFYNTGFICLSILNTWAGEQWTGCQSITSVLLALCSVLDNEPYLHEPGITKYSEDYDDFSKIVQYANINISILSMLDKISLSRDNFYVFKQIALEHFKNNYEHILKFIVSHKNEPTYSCNVWQYGMEDIFIDYNKLKTKLLKYKQTYLKK